MSPGSTADYPWANREQRVPSNLHRWEQLIELVMNELAAGHLEVFECEVNGGRIWDVRYRRTGYTKTLFLARRDYHLRSNITRHGLEVMTQLVREHVRPCV